MFGKIHFLLVRIKIKHMELAIIRREASGTLHVDCNDRVCVCVCVCVCLCLCLCVCVSMCLCVCVVLYWLLCTHLIAYLFFITL